MLKIFQFLVFFYAFDLSNEKNLSTTQKYLFGRTVLWNDTPSPEYVRAHGPDLVKEP